MTEIQEQEETKDSGIKLNPLEATDKETKVNKKDNVKYTDGNKGVPATSAPAVPAGGSKETALDPHIEKNEAEKNPTPGTTTTTDENGNKVEITVNPDGTTTKVTTIKEESAKEPEPVDYPTEEIDKTGGIPKEEQVEVEEREEKQEPNTSETLPIDGNGNKQNNNNNNQQPATEKVTYEEEVEYDKTYDGNEVDDGYSLTYTMRGV